MRKAKQKHGFVGLRIKILIPILLICLFILIGAIVLTTRVCYWIFESTLDARVMSCYDAITDHRLTYSPENMSPEIADKDVFNGDWFNDKDLLDLLDRVDCAAAVYRYDPEQKSYVLSGTPDNKEDCIPVIDDIWAETLNSDGSVTIPDIGYDNTNRFWVFIREKDPTDAQTPRAIGAGVEAEELSINLFGFLALAAIIMVISVTLIYVIISMIVTRTIKRIRKVSGYLETVTAESLPSKPLVINTRDEIGRMSGIVNRMVEGLRDRNRMETELNVAADIQQDMLPEPLPEHERFVLHASMQPAKEVAGDFYDFFMIDERRLALLIADVSGKGVPAALFMAIGKKLLRNALKSGMQPKDAVTNVNKSLIDNNKLSLFITAWVGVLDLDSGVITYTNAGHNPPYILGSPFVTLSDIHGTPLAVFDQVYKEDTFSLHPGDTLFLYTDGVNEAFNTDGVMYTTERLVSELESYKPQGNETLIDYIGRSVRDFRGEAEQSDDITMLEMTLKDKKSQNSDT